MKINLKKTKVMVFRNGGIIKQNEKWFFEGKPIEITPYYDYLGLTVGSRMKWTKATQNLRTKAQKAINLIKIFNKKYDNTDINVTFNLFDKMVLPILLYGAEIWGTEVRKHIEAVHNSSVNMSWE